MSNEIAKTRPSIRQELESPSFAAQIAKVLPKHITPARMVRVAITAMTKQPKLSECDPATVYSCLLTLSSIGLEPDGRLAHLVPFFNTKRNVYECTLIVDWKGLAQIVYRSGQVSNLHADVIYQGDLFGYNCGQITTHVPHFLRTDSDAPTEQGRIIGAYAIATMKDGTKPAVVISEAAIQKIRARSKAANSGPWVTDTDEMRKKTAFRRLSKWLPVRSEELTTALDVDDDGGDSITNVTDTARPEIQRLAPVELPEPTPFVPVAPVVMPPAAPVAEQPAAVAAASSATPDAPDEIQLARERLLAQFTLLGIGWPQVRLMGVESGWRGFKPGLQFEALSLKQIEYLVKNIERIAAGIKASMPPEEPAQPAEVVG